MSLCNNCIIFSFSVDLVQCKQLDFKCSQPKRFRFLFDTDKINYIFTNSFYRIVLRHFKGYATSVVRMPIPRHHLDKKLRITLTTPLYAMMDINWKSTRLIDAVPGTRGQSGTTICSLPRVLQWDYSRRAILMNDMNVTK